MTDSAPSIETIHGPSYVISKWIEDFQFIYSEWSADLCEYESLYEDFEFEDALICYDLLALWAKGRRQSDALSLVQAKSQQECFQVLDELVREHCELLCSLAITVPNTEAWTEDLVEFIHDSTLNYQQRRQVSKSLLRHLDDAHCVAYALDYFESEFEEELAQELSHCDALLLRNLEHFEPSKHLIVITFNSFSREKENGDPRLWSLLSNWYALFDSFKPEWA